MKVYPITIDPRKIKLLKKNARYMKHEEYTRLVENIRRDGVLTSTPFLCKEGDDYLCLSGNHRTQASIEAGLAEIDCLATDTPLSNDQKIAIQLSHNAIVGQDDPATLKALYEEILDTELKKYSGLDDKTLELMGKFNTFSISEANLAFQTLTMVFLPDELEAAKKIIGEAIAASKSGDEIWLARMAEYDRWLDDQEIASSAHNVKNVATAVDLILRVFERNMAQLSEAWEDTDDDKRWVPIESVLGRGKIPAQSAKVIKKALDRMAGRDEISAKTPWQGLEFLCADYLAGE